MKSLRNILMKVIYRQIIFREKIQKRIKECVFM